MKIDLILKFKQNLVFKVFWSSTCNGSYSSNTITITCMLLYHDIRPKWNGSLCLFQLYQLQQLPCVTSSCVCVEFKVSIKTATTLGSNTGQLYVNGKVGRHKGAVLLGSFCRGTAVWLFVSLNSCNGRVANLKEVTFIILHLSIPVKHVKCNS